VIPKTISLVAKYDSATKSFKSFYYKVPGVVQSAYDNNPAPKPITDHFWVKPGYVSLNNLNTISISMDKGKEVSKNIINLFGIIYILVTGYYAVNK